MADVRTLELKIVADAKGIQVISSEAGKANRSIQNLGRQNTSTFDAMNRSLSGVQSQIGGLILSTAKWTAILGTIGSSVSLAALVKQGIEFDKILETSRIGLAAVVAATQEISDSQGEVLEGQEKFNAALQIAQEIQVRLQKANLETSATFEQLLLTSQAIIAAGSAQGINLEDNLKLTVALVQATTGIGLEMRQAVSESRSLLEGSINPMTDQLANALGITSKMVKEWQKQGTLVQELESRLENFVRAGKLTQQSFAGVTSNLKDAVSVASGQAFKGFFDSLKRVGFELQTSIVTFEGDIATVNPKLLEIGQAIDDELVAGFEAAAAAVKLIFQNVDADSIEETFKDIRREFADFLDELDVAVQFVKGTPDFATYGIIGYMLFGVPGAIVGIMAALKDDVEIFRKQMDEASTKSALSVNNVIAQNEKAIQNLESKIEQVKQAIKDLNEKSPLTDASDFFTTDIFDTLSEVFIGKSKLRKELEEELRSYQRAIKEIQKESLELISDNRLAIENELSRVDTAIQDKLDSISQLRDKLSTENIDTSKIQEITEQLSIEETQYQNLIGYREDLQILLNEYAIGQSDVSAEQETQATVLGTIADKLRESLEPQAEISNYSKLITDNTFTYYTGLGIALGLLREIENTSRIIAAIKLSNEFADLAFGGGRTTTPISKPRGDGDSEAKKAARERERIEEQLRDSINKITLDREEYERVQIQETVEKAKKAGADKVLITQFQAAKELEIERQKADELKKIIDSIVKEQEERNKEALEKFAELQLSNLPESQQIRAELQKEFDFLDQLLAKFPEREEEIQKERLATQQRYSALIIDAEKQEYIQRLKDSESFIDNLKGGFLEFVDSVENDSETISQFFADTLSQMSQSFSDLFYNVVTGKFDDLKDVAKNAFKAILRAFIDMVSAIATRQIIIKVGGLFGLGGQGGQSGSGGTLGTAQQGVGAGLQIGGLFGAGGAIETLGAAFGGGLAGVEALPGAASLIASSELTTLATPGFLATAGAAITVVGAVLAAAALAFTIIAPLLEKTPRIDLDFDEIETEMGKRAAFINEILDPDLFQDIFNVSVKRQAGLGVGGDDKIREIVFDAIKGAYDNVVAIITQLPSDIANQLIDDINNTQIDRETVVGGERLFEFDAKGKKIKEKFEQFINGELQAKFLFVIDDVLVDTLEAIGTLPKEAQRFIDEKFDEFKNAKGREARAKIGQELLADIDTFIDAFNVLSGRATDSIGQSIQQIQSLANSLGFKGIPSIEELDDELQDLIDTAGDPESIRKLLDLRNAIQQVQLSLVQNITSIINQIQSLNESLSSIGLPTIDTSGASLQIQQTIIDALNSGNLSLDLREQFLGVLSGIANQQLQQEQVAAAAREQVRIDRERTKIEANIKRLQSERDLIDKNSKARLDALNEELSGAQALKNLYDSVTKTLEDILLSTNSVLTPVEQVNYLQARISELQSQIAVTSDPEKLAELGGELEDAFKNILDRVGETFGINSPEFVAAFDQVTGGLKDLQDITQARGRTVEEINAEIERLTEETNKRLEAIDAKIERGQDRISKLSEQTANNTFRASKATEDLFRYLSGEYEQLLKDRLDQLAELGEEAITSEIDGLQQIYDTAKQQTEIQEEQLVVLRQIRDGIGNVPSLQSGGVVKATGLHLLHEGEIVTNPANGQSAGGVNIIANINIDGSNNPRETGQAVENMLYHSIKRGKLRKAIQEVSNSKL